MRNKKDSNKEAYYKEYRFKCTVSKGKFTRVLRHLLNC